MEKIVLKSKLNTHIEEIHTLEGLTTKEAAEYFTKTTENTENFDDSFYICDLGDVTKSYQKWEKLFPNIRPYYAVKSAPHISMVALIASLGGGFDCASLEELDLALKCGASPDSIFFANPCKKLSHIVHAKKMGIKKLVFDDDTELHKIKKIYPEASLILRIDVDDSTADGQLSIRFGATVDRSIELLKTVKELDLEVIGICFHVGSGINDKSVYTKALRDARTLFDYAKTLGMDFTVLDIGGGFPPSSRTNPSIEEIAVVLNRGLDEMFSLKQNKGLQIISEPGRYFAATAFTMATCVLSKRVPLKFDNVKIEYTLSEGVHGGLRYLDVKGMGEMLPFVLDNEANMDKSYARLWGPTVDGGDQLGEKALVPRLEMGDWLFWKNAGAYSFACASRFNGFDTTMIYNVISDENKQSFWDLCREKFVKI